MTLRRYWGRGAPKGRMPRNGGSHREVFTRAGGRVPESNTPSQEDLEQNNKGLEGTNGGCSEDLCCIFTAQMLANRSAIPSLPPLAPHASPGASRKPRKTSICSRTAELCSGCNTLRRYSLISLV